MLVEDNQGPHNDILHKTVTLHKVIAHLDEVRILMGLGVVCNGPQLDACYASCTADHAR
jgi:hypothetical protein